MLSMALAFPHATLGAVGEQRGHGCPEQPNNVPAPTTPIDGCSA
jgi:hypothetical protein